jgi:hypothetical protein
MGGVVVVVSSPASSPQAANIIAQARTSAIVERITVSSLVVGWWVRRFDVWVGGVGSGRRS